MLPFPYLSWTSKYWANTIFSLLNTISYISTKCWLINIIRTLSKIVLLVYRSGHNVDQVATSLCISVTITQKYQSTVLSIQICHILWHFTRVTRDLKKKKCWLVVQERLRYLGSPRGHLISSKFQIMSPRPCFCLRIIACGNDSQWQPQAYNCCS